MPDRKALCLVSGGLEEIGPTDRLLLPGDPDFDLHAASKQYIDRRFGNDLDVGEEIFSRDLLNSSGQATTTQTLRLSYFTARKTETTTQVRFSTGSAAAGATPTLVRVGLYLIAASDNGTLVAGTANDTSLFASVSATYTRSWIASYAKVAGQRYALGVLVVTTAAAPTMLGTIVALSAELVIKTRITGAIGGQTDLPSSFLATAVGTSASRPYGVILP